MGINVYTPRCIEVQRARIKEGEFYGAFLEIWSSYRYIFESGGFYADTFFTGIAKTISGLGI